MIYLIGSLRNPVVPQLANDLRKEGYEVFDDWYAAGPEADDYWQKYEKERGRDYVKALNGYAANHVFNYDREHLDDCRIGVLILPAGKSGHLELGYLIGQRKPCFILLDKEPERFDVMYRFAAGVFTTPQELIVALDTWNLELRPQALPANSLVNAYASWKGIWKGKFHAFKDRP